MGRGRGGIESGLRGMQDQGKSEFLGWGLVFTVSGESEADLG